MSGYTEVLTRTVIASGALTAKLAVAPSGAQAGAGERVLGVVLFDQDDTKAATVIVQGTAPCLAGAAVSANGLVESDSAGKVIPWKNGHPMGLALEAASVAGEEIEVLLLPPSLRDVPAMPATGDIAAQRFVTPASVQAGVGDRVIGVSVAAILDGETGLVNIGERAYVVAGDAVSAGALVEPDANGKAVTHKNGHPAAIAVEASAQDGDVIEVRRMPVSAEPIIDLVAGAGGVGANLLCQADGTLPGAGEAVVGVALAAALEAATARVRTSGIAYVIAGDAVTAGADVEATAAGKVIAKDTGLKVGAAIDAAAQDGDVIRVRLTA